MKTTIVIVTRNRPESLEATLATLLHHKYISVDVLVIDSSDNQAKDRNHENCRAYNFRYIYEPKRGLSLARNRGVHESTTDIVAFTDDDAFPCRDWIEHHIASYSDQRVMCVTGRVLPFGNDEESKRFEKYCGQDLGAKPRIFTGVNFWNWLAPFKVGHGVNFSIRKSAIEKVGGFDTRYGTGGPFKAGEEIEMFYRILKAKHSIAYNPASVVYHDRRMTSL